MKAIVAACESGRLDGKVTTVISSQTDTQFQLTKGWCNIRGIECYHNRRDFYDFEWMQHAILDALIGLSKPDLICLAGYMSILPAHIVEKYKRKMINIHPSLLPKYKGLRTHERALANKDINDVYHGATTHFVTAELDSGPIIKQKLVSKDVNDTVETLKARVSSIEHELYISSIEEIFEKGIDKCYEECLNRTLPELFKQNLQELENLDK